MKLSKILSYVKATLYVEVEGYFVERFINLCKLNNVNIWDIKNVASGKISFCTVPSELKKMKIYLNRTKCKLNITKKKGIYYDILKYKKRKVALIMLLLVILGSYIYSTFIWNINIYGNENITTEQIISELNNLGVKVGKNQFAISKGKISDYIRAKIYEVAWVGVDIKGTTLDIQIVEKVISTEKEDNTILGDIVAIKSAVITKIVADNGIAKYKLGSYVEEGSILIEGKRYINGEPDKLVHASGTVRGETEYVFEKEYNFKEIEKLYTDKIKYGVGFGINNKNFVIKCLPKDYLYDISSEEKNFNIFGIEFKYSFNKYAQYTENEKINTKEDLIKRAAHDALQFLNNLILNDKTLKNELVTIEETQDKIVYKVIYTIDENIGKFVKVGE
ncbi:MAG: sporulation protein YqfD [Clostridia bacterium]|nr:sporulation protein YqfD [Clostridia bacterium]